MKNQVARAGGADKILHFGSTVTKALEMQVSFDSGNTGFGVVLGRDDTDSLQNLGLAFHPESQQDYTEELSTRGTGEDFSVVQEHIRRLIGAWRLFHFHDTSSTSPLKKTADLHDNRFLRPDGSNLAAFLYYLRKKKRKSYCLIQRTVQLVAPFFEDFLLEPLALNEDRIRLEWIHRGTNYYFDVSSFSDGTLRFIALATLLLQHVHATALPDSVR